MAAGPAPLPPAQAGAIAFAPAKLNLALHVLGRRDDGRHELDMLVAFADIGDRLEAQVGGTVDGLEVDGPFAAALGNGDNLVLRACALLRDRAQPGAPAVRLRLTKRLPVASGIGGGSADAAATLRLLCTLWGIPLAQAAALAPELGADVPMCLASRPSRAAGIGERLTPLPLPADWPVVLVNPGMALSTAAVFAGLACRSNAPLPGLPDPLTPAALAATRNDLTAAALALVPAIGEAIEALAAQPGALLARMSGSGATAFALFASREAARQAAAAIARARPGWWVADGLLPRQGPSLTPPSGAAP